jgi:hypothetical protein
MARKRAVSGLAAPDEQLAAAWMRLQSRWEASGDDWNDAVRAYFEARYWQALAAQVGSTHGEMERLVQTIRRIRLSVRESG